MKVTSIGDKDLIRKLETLRKTSFKKAIRRGSRQGSKIHLSEAKAEAPSRTDKLRASLVVRALPRSRRWIGTETRFTIYYGSFVELGTKNRNRLKAYMFLRKSFRAVKPQALNAFVEAAKEEIKNVT